MSNSGNAEVLIPRGLCSLEKTENLNIDEENFCSVFLSWEEGIVSEIKPSKTQNKKPRKVLLPRFVETHAHIDKSFTWREFPNLNSTYEGALSINLQEHKTRTNDKLLERVERSLNLAIKNGYRAIRSHIDTFQSQGINVWIVSI